MRWWWMVATVGACGELPDADIETRDAVCNAIAEYVAANPGDFQGDTDPLFQPELRDCEAVRTLNGSGEADVLVAQPDAGVREYQRRWLCDVTEYDQGWEVDACTESEDVGWVDL